MRIILFILSILAFLAGAGIFAASQSAIHEIEAFCLFLISAVLLTGACIVEAVNVHRKKSTEHLKALDERLTTELYHVKKYLQTTADTLSRAQIE